MSGPAFYISQSDIQWIRKLATELGMPSVVNENMDLVVWRALRELHTRTTRLEDKLNKLSRSSKHNSTKDNG